jgi:putative cell wall-binding protein
MKSKKLIAIVMSVAICLPIFSSTNIQNKTNIVKAESTTTEQQTSRVTRLGGKDRYDTAVQISQYGWKSADTVFLAGAETNTEFADALAGTPLAYSEDAPILITRHNSIPTVVSTEIKRLKPKNITILGGTGVVSQSIENSLKAQGYNVTRIAGKDRYETAVQIAKALWAKYPSTDDKYGSDKSVIITTGKQFQYAMATAVGAARSHVAILFSDGDTLNSEVSNLIFRDKHIQGIHVVGSDKVLGIKGSLYNSDRGIFYISDYDNIAELEKGEGKLENYTGVAVANDKTFPDSLTGSALAAKMNYNLVLTDGENFPYTVEPIENTLSGGLIFGGTGVVSSNMPNKIEAILNKNIAPNPNGLKDTDIVPFSDEKFKEEAEKSLGKTNITLGEAKQATGLTLNGVTNLSDLKYFPNLIGLTLNNCSVNNANDFDNIYYLYAIELNDCTFDKSLITSLKNVAIVVNHKDVYNLNNK